MHAQSNDVLRCTNQELIAKLQQLARADRALSVQLLLHLAEMDARGFAPRPLLASPRRQPRRLAVDSAARV